MNEQHLLHRVDPWNDHRLPESFTHIDPLPGIAELIKVFRAHNCLRILDLGCGSGRYIIHLLNAGFQVWGADPAPGALQLARQWAASAEMPCALVQAAFRHPLPFASAVFDGLICSCFLHPSPPGAICHTVREAIRVVRKGGVLFLTVPERMDEEVEYVEIMHSAFAPTLRSKEGAPNTILSWDELQLPLNSLYILDIRKPYPGVRTILAVR